MNVRRDGRAAAAFLFLTLVWGTTWAAIRIALAGFPPLEGVAARFTIAGTVLLVWARVRGIPIGRTSVERRLWLANGLLTFVVSYGIIYWSEQRVPSGLAAVIFGTFPLWVVLLAALLLRREPIPLGRSLAVGVGYLGVAVVFSENLDATIGPGALGSAAMLLLAALASALGSVLLKRYGEGIPPVSLAAPPMLLAGLVLWPVAALLEGGLRLPAAPAPWLATLYLALVGSAATFPVYFWLLSRRSVIAAALVSYTAPVVAVAIGVFALGEPFTLRLAVGSLLVLAGVAGALTRRRRAL